MFNPQMPPEDFLFLDQVLFCVLKVDFRAYHSLSFLVHHDPLI